jgi:hypothetical protein
MNIIYKILCEVKLMHEYYLTEEPPPVIIKEQNVFNFATQKERLDFLQKQFLKPVPHIGNDLLLVFPDTLRSLYNGYHLKVIPSYSGFKIAVKCKKIILPDGARAFAPLAPLPGNLEIFVALQQKTTIENFTQLSIRKPIRTAWYFSNDDTTGKRIFPFLTAPVAERNSSVTYEQGVLADIGGGIIAEFLNNGAADSWKPIVGSRYTSNSDELLVPFRFEYRFTEADQVQNAVFVLKDAGGNEIQRITKSDTRPLKSVVLNFTPQPTIVIRTIPKTPVSAESIYTLQVSGNNGYSRNFRMLFTDPVLPIGQYAGLVSIKPRPGNADFRLVQTGGYLPLTDVAGNPQVPVFEIWMKSKSVFLKYQHNRQKNIQLSAQTTGLLKSENGVLISENPVNLSYQAVSYRKQDNSFQLLPNPKPDNSVQIEDGRFLVKLLIPDSALFPLE